MKNIPLVIAFWMGMLCNALAQQADQAVQSAQNVKLQNATGINTTEREFSPMFFQNGIVFLSSRNKQGPLDEELGETFFDVYFSELDPNGMPLKPRPFSVEINSQVHEGPLSFNQKGTHVYFTRSAASPRMSKSNGKIRTYLQIFEANKGEFDWENVHPMPFNGNYSCMHPSLSIDGTKLFFTSTMPGGYGGTDIYFVEKQEDKWSKPVNMGPEINTEKNEAFPFFHESGILFFTSDGHAGYGGIDLFKIDLSGQTWGKIINIGKPFNSEKDDLGFVINAQGSRGYFSSNRDGGSGKDDVYFFETPEGLPGLEVKSKINVVISVYDASNSRRMMGAAIRVFERTDGLIDNQQLYTQELAPSDDDSGEYTFKMLRKKESELGEPRQLTNRNGEGIIQLEEDRDYLFLISKADYSSQEVTYSTKNMTLPRPVEVILQPRNCLALMGTVKSEQLNRLIPNAKVRVKNECTGKEEIVMTNVNGVFEYCLEIGCDYTIISEKKGYAQGFTEISTVKIRGNRSAEVEIKMTPTASEIMRQPLQKGSVIVMENIYYDFNESTIRSSENQELKSLAELMKQNTSMEIELAAYTDSRGDSNYNLELSLKRAEKAKAFLMQQGINGKRIQTFGFGESKLRNHCKDGVECSEEDHAYNRRTEVTVSRMGEAAPKEFSEKGGKGR